jgi:hypothetical protein
MKKLFFTLIIFLPSLATFGKTPLFKVIARSDSHRAVEENVQLKDLISSNSFDGKYFKVVRGKDEDAVRFDASEDLVFKAANVYYHLTKARDYFTNQLKSEYVTNLPKMIIRIEHKNQFSELGHFAHDNLDPQFNNALTIPAGKGLASRNIKPWGIEIWFRPQKKIHISELNANNLQSQEFKVLMRGFRNQIHMQSLQRFLAQSVNILVNGSQGGRGFSLDQVMRTAGSSLIMEFGYQFYDPIAKATSRKNYWLDTAMVPEIIYHEFAHAALSDHLVLSRSTAIIEGMADFFAGQIAGSPKLAKRIKKYNTFNGKNAKRKQDYILQFEMSEYANTDFVFGLLWEMKSILGEKKGESFMFELRKRLTTEGTIRKDLVDGLITTCEESCETPFQDKLSILKALNYRGL